MDYSFGAAIGAGLVATAAMTAVLYMGFFMMPKQVPMNLLYMLGTMMTPSKVPAYIVGAMIHTMMGIAFALIHTGIYQGLDVDSNLAAWGLLFGFVHWIVVGMAFGMIGMMHPLMRSGQMPAPGAFVKNLPMMTVVGFLTVHLLHGVLLGYFTTCGSELSQTAMTRSGLSA